MDTGSDLVWFPCSPFECILCEGKETPSAFPSPPPPPPVGSHLISCRSPACAAAHSAVASSSSSSDLCAIAGCPLDDIETASSCAAHPCPTFYYAYGDGSLVTRLRRGLLSAGPLRLPDFTFACAHSALAEPVGVAGFGRAGPLSLPSQLAAWFRLLEEETGEMSCDQSLTVYEKRARPRGIRRFQTTGISPVSSPRSRNRVKRCPSPHPLQPRPVPRKLAPHFNPHTGTVSGPLQFETDTANVDLHFYTFHAQNFDATPSSYKAKFFSPTVKKTQNLKLKAVVASFALVISANQTVRVMA